MSEGSGGGAPAGRGEGAGISLRWKAVALFALVALIPAGLTLALLAFVNRDAVETSEKQVQSAVLADLAGTATREVQAAEDDALAVSAALSYAAAHPAPGGDANAPVRAILATRRTVDAVRFEVPSAGVNTVIARDDASATAVPQADPALLAAADQRGIAFSALPGGDGVVVVPVRGTTEVKGYVTARVRLDRVRQAVADAAASRFDSADVRIVVADEAHRAVAVFGVPGVSPGDDVGNLAVWTVLPEGTTWTTRVGVVSPHSDKGVAMVGGVETVPQLGWAVALWRTEQSAYRNLSRLRQAALYVGGGALLLAVLIGLLAGRAVTRPIIRMAGQTRLVGQRRWREVRIDASSSDELGQLARSIGRMAADLESGEQEIERQARLRGDLSRFLSRELVDAIVRGEHPLELGGRRMPITVLFADVVAFTPMAESGPPERVVALLNDLFSVLSEVVFRHEGMVDKFIGDCIMAVWGAARPMDDHARRALAAAQDMMRFLETANEEWKDKYGIEIRLGIGVNSGDAIVGNIGSNKRMEFTVIGDVVNVAARLEQIAQPNQVLAGEKTYELGREHFALALLGEHNLTGRKTASKVYLLET